jgi:hypothetical protein
MMSMLLLKSNICEQGQEPTLEGDPLGLASKYYNTVEVTENIYHSSLLQLGFNYDYKKFCDTGTLFTTLHFLLNLRMGIISLSVNYTMLKGVPVTKYSSLLVDSQATTKIKCCEYAPRLLRS